MPKPVGETVTRKARLPLTELEGLLTGSSAASWRPFFAERVHLRLGSRSVAIGVDQAMDELALLFGTVGAVGSSILDIWPIPSGVVVDTDLMPLPAVPSHALVPCAVIIHQDRAGRLLDVRFYFDPAHFFQSQDPA